MKLNLSLQSQNELRIQKEMLKRKRRSRRNQVRESFNCECGKTYLSFSALYLHAKIKHELKLTTQEKSDICQIERTCGFAQYTYSISQGNTKNTIEFNEEKEKEKNFLKSSNGDSSQQCQESGTYRETYPSCFKEYLAKPLSDWEKNILSLFLEYAFPKYKETQKSTKQQIYGLPYLFNPFVLEYMPLNHAAGLITREGMKICRILQNFYMWLKDSEMTDLTVFCNSNY